MHEITRLEAKLRNLEIEKIKLLKRELTHSANLRHKSKILGFHLDELEAIYLAEARKRELEITKLYSRFNNEISSKIKHAEGNLEVIQRRRTRAVTKKDNILFDGIRDKKLKANWD